MRLFTKLACHLTDKKDIVMEHDDIVSLFGGTKELLDRIQYYLDENVDQRIIGPLRKKGITVHTPQEQSMRTEVNDTLQLAKATELGCVLVTADQDFMAINEAINDLWVEHGTVHAGIVFVSGPRSPGVLIAQLEQIVREREPEQMYNLFWPI